MAKKNQRFIFLLEGEMEQALLKGLGCIGKMKIYNLWNREIKKIYPILKADVVFIVYDTDITNNSQRFIGNLNFLLKNKVRFVLLQQTENLEDEILRCCSQCSNVNEIFKTAGISEFKSEFIKCKNLLYKLNLLAFQPIHLWSEDIHSIFSDFKDKQGGYKNIPII